MADAEPKDAGEARRMKPAARTIARDISLEFETTGGIGGRLADRLTLIAGSWSFILAFMAGLAVWTLLNSEVLGTDAFDPYPYIFLNLVLSMLAAIQAPIMLMAQNRQAGRDRLEARHDYEVNRKAELEIMALHERVERLRANEIAALHASVERLAAALEQARRQP